MAAGLLLAGRYQLIEKLGAGGMGTVWRAQDLTLNADIAIKLLEPEFVASPEAVHRFRREAQAAAAIRSTHVVQIFDYGIDEDKPFIAMELLKGEDLERRLARVGCLGSEVTARVLGQVARAIALAHDHGIVHRDLKPANIFLAREYDDEVTKVLDFGIARKPGALAEIGGLQTRTGMVMGTPYYMSPEQASGQPVNHLTDIWSFGIIASECLTGRRVFQCDTLGELFHAVCVAPMPVPSEIGPVPEDFDAWFARATARDQALRFQGMREAADSLQLLAGRGSGLHRLELESAQSRDGTPVPQPTTPAAFVAPQVTTTLEETVPPSSHSASNLMKPRHRAQRYIAVALVTLVVSGLLLGWRWLHQSSSAQTIATGASSVTVAPLLTTNANGPRGPVSGVVAGTAPVVTSTTKAPEPPALSDLGPSGTSKGQQQVNPRLAATATPSVVGVGAQGAHPRSQSAATTASSKPSATPTPFVGSKIDPRIGL